MSNDTQPEIRFPGFTEAWEQRKLGEIVQITMGQSPNSENYTENPEDYILVQGNADMKNNRVVPRVWTTQITKQAEKGDLILSVRAPVGDIGKTDYDVVLGRGVAAIKGNDFIFQQLWKMKESGYWNRFSTGLTFESINSNDIREALITIPTGEEQQKIGTFFKQLDDTITLHQRKLDLLKETKKGFLQKMFPKNGAKVPEIRFPGFTEDWEERKLKELFQPSKNKNNNGLYNQKDILAASLGTELIPKRTFFGLKSTRESVKNYRIVKTGDLIYTKSPIKGFPNGIIRSNKGNVGIVPPLYCVYTLQKDINSSIIQLYFEDKNRLDFYLFPLVNVGARNNVNITDLEFLEGKVTIPKSYEEQSKIVQFMEQLNTTITLHQRKLDLLKETKKGFLQKMFTEN